jgi:hypothetical protein
MVRVIDGRPTIVAEVAEADSELRAFLQGQFAAILGSNYLAEALQDYVDSGREDLVHTRVRALAGENAS